MSGFNFSGAAGAGGFSGFGTPTTKPPTTGVGFAFGTPASSGATAGFNLGTVTPATSTAPPSTGFSFGGAPSVQAPAAPTGGFNFGGTPTAMPAGGVTLGTSTSGGFSFGANTQAVRPNVGFTTPAATAVGIATPQQAPSVGLTFGAMPVAAPTTGGPLKFSFGTPGPNTAQPTTAVVKPAGGPMAMPQSSAPATQATGFSLSNLAQPTQQGSVFAGMGTSQQVPQSGFAGMGTSPQVPQSGFAGMGTSQQVQQSGFGATVTSQPAQQGGFAATSQPGQSTLLSSLLKPSAGPTTSTPAAGFTLSGAAKPASLPASTPAPSSGFSFLNTTATPSSAPTTSANIGFGLKLGATASTTTTTTTTAAGTSLSSTTKPASGLTFNITTTSAVASTTPATLSTSTTTTSSAAHPPPSMNYRQVEEMINKCTLELEEQEKMFLQQATQVNAWDRLLIENGDKITQLNSDVEKVNHDQKRLDHELDFIQAQQKELEEMLVPIEKAVEELPVIGYSQHADLEREHTYQLAENIDAQLKRMIGDLKDIVEHLNSSNANQDTTDPIYQIARILNAHMDSLQWVDQNSAMILRKVEEISKIAQVHRNDQERNFRLAYNK